jgi:response regulator RpfG family c-di-GMP phosphodiesterase
MHSLGNIFLYNNNMHNKELYHHELEQKGYFIFDTDNLHKFTLYHKEITPDVLIFDFDNKTPTTFISSIERHFERSTIPLIVISEAPKPLIYHPHISHYLTHTEAKEKLLNIIETYSIGNKQNQILYINLKPYEKNNFANSVIQKGYSIFEVHNINSALNYLKKNKATIICINFLPALSKSQKLFSHPKSFYVENTQNIEEIEQFLI